MWILHILIFNLTLVLLTEGMFGFLLGASSFRKIVTVILSNIITNPIVVLSAFTLTLFSPAWHTLGLLLLEVLAIVTEGFIFSLYKTFGRKNPYIISLILNITSFTIGEIINIFL